MAKNAADSSSRSSLTVVLVGGIWLVSFTLTTVISKNALGVRTLGSKTTPTTDTLKWVELSSLQHALGFFISSIAVMVVGKSLWPPQISEHRMMIFVAAVCNTLATLASNAALTTQESGLAHLVESFQPIFTYLLMFALTRGSDALSISTFYSVAILSIGVSSLVVRNMTASSWVLLTALTSSGGLALRNVMLKRSGEKWDSSVQKLMFVSLLCTIFTFLLWLVKVALTQSLSINRLSVLSGTTHSVYSLASFNVLESVNAVTHAIVAILIMALTSTIIDDYSLVGNFSLGFFCNVLFSVLVILIGVLFYNLKDMTSKRRGLPMIIFFLLTLLYVFVGPSQTNIKPNLTQEYHCNRTVFTTWVYDKPMPPSVVSNIIALADQNPDLVVNVYCGNSQCMNAINQERKKMMKDSEGKKNSLNVIFAVISDIVQETALQSWFQRHPFNKMLAGKYFEDHLNEVTMLALLWKYGGAYVSPNVILEGSMDNSFNCLKPLAVVNEEDGTVFIYSPTNHPFVHILAQMYVRSYPTTRKRLDSVGAEKHFHNAWKAAHYHCSSLDCPVMGGFSYSLLHPIEVAIEANQTNHFGMFVYSSADHSPSISDLEDEIQDLAGLYLLPFVDTIIDRDGASAFVGRERVTAFFNGWGSALPKTNWQPPASNVHPIMLSVKLQEGMAEKWKEQSIYLKQHGSIGCSDANTLKYLTEHKVEAYLGALTLFIRSPFQQKMPRQDIYVTDISNDLLQLLPSNIQKSVLRGRNPTTSGSRDHVERFRGMYQLVENLGTAKLVITQCFHCALACVAMDTPVIFIDASKSRTSPAAGMTSLFHTLDLHNKTKEQTKAWLADFPWENIPPNPDVALMMRLRATAWHVIRQNQALYDSAKKFGIIPLHPPRVLPNDQKILFHMIFTSSNVSVLSVINSGNNQSGAFNWRHWRSVESVFRFHPTSDLIIHSNTLPQSLFDVLTESGYSITVSPYNLTELLNGSPAENFISRLEQRKTGQFWVYNEANLLRLLFLYLQGGMYLDTDIVLVRRVDSLEMNAFGKQGKATANNAVLLFDKGHPFLKFVLEQFVKHYNGDVWAFNGQRRISESLTMWKRSNSTPISIWEPQLFYMMSWKNVKEECFELVSGPAFDRNLKTLRTKSYGVHINAKMTGDVSKVKDGTLCSILLNQFCVFCDHVF